MDAWLPESTGPLAVLQKDARFAKQTQSTIVLFHGYGASASDLAGLASILDSEQNFQWIFPEGHLLLESWPGGRSAAWWHINQADLESAMARGTQRNMTGGLPEGAAKAAERAKECFAQLGLQAQNLLLGGFSQGAMLATELALALPEQVRGLIILSGNLLDQTRWQKLALQKKGLPFFQSHGDQDQVLSPRHAAELADLLKKSGLAGSLRQFSGGHEIPPEILLELKNWLDPFID